MARPREFDVGAAVEQAMRLFWARGYTQTSLSELEGALGIGRASIYAAFSDKETLFLRALDRYREQYTLPCLAVLDGALPPSAALAAYFDCLAARYAGGPTPAGCLVVLNISCIGEDAPRARQALAASTAAGRDRIALTLRRAVSAGELPAALPVPALAEFLVASTQGMATMARLGRPEKAVRQIGHIALSVLGRTPGS